MGADSGAAHRNGFPRPRPPSFRRTRESVTDDTFISPPPSLLVFGLLRGASHPIDSGTSGSAEASAGGEDESWTPERIAELERTWGSLIRLGVSIPAELVQLYARHVSSRSRSGSSSQPSPSPSSSSVVPPLPEDYRLLHVPQLYPECNSFCRGRYLMRREWTLHFDVPCRVSPQQDTGRVRLLCRGPAQGHRSCTWTRGNHHLQIVGRVGVRHFLWQPVRWLL
jgi:hypothetical protein